MRISSKISLLLLSLSVINSAQGFRFQGQEETSDKIKNAKEPIVPEQNEPNIPIDSQREEKKIEPLIVDVERKPVEGKTELSEEEAEGRFFLKDKLCALGLADVSDLKS